MNEYNIKNRNIVIVGQQPWDVEIGSNCKNIAEEFSKDNRVLYVNCPLDRITSIRERTNPKTQKRLNVIKGKENGIVKIKENLWNLYPDCLVESINWLNIEALFDFVNRRNNKRFAASIKQALKELHFDNIILFNDNEFMKCFYLKELLQPSISIYYSRDNMVATDYWKKHGVRLEPMMIEKSDVCVTNSTFLADYCKEYNLNTFYVGQGCDVEKLSTNTAGFAVELRQMKSTVIGYVGALVGTRLDVQLMAYIAERHPEWSIVLIGSEDEHFKNSVLHKMKNVHFLGLKSSTEVVSYLNSIDVCINPQLINLLTIGNYPRKVDEYLALGKPVVATRTKAMEIFEKYVYLASNKEEYVALIEKALTGNSTEKQKERKAFACTHTWENSVKEIYKAASYDMHNTNLTLNYS